MWGLINMGLDYARFLDFVRFCNEYSMNEIESLEASQVVLQI